MNRFILTLSALSAAALALPAAALAQEVQTQEACAPRDQIVQKLASDFKEQQQAVGVVNKDAVLEVFVSGKGTWTIIATGTDGNSCVISAGQDWNDANLVKGLDASADGASTTRPDSPTIVRR
jgi:hypothetical protein